MLCIYKYILFFLPVFSFLVFPASFFADVPAQDNVALFKESIQPLLQERCISCHGAEQQAGRLRLDGESHVLKGGFTGPAIIPGNSENSLLIQKVRGTAEGMRMPVNGEPLSKEEILILKKWIDSGVNRGDEDDSVQDEPLTSHWAYQPRTEAQPPKVQNQEWVLNPIDHFVLAKLEERGIEPSPRAEKTTLIRRLYLDLTGLLPTPDEVSDFVQDESPDAYEQLVDRLLASPHFGERWARHWLDLARYADSDGYEKDLPRPYAWRYRDWLIKAINDDMPFDQFTIEQLAGDLLPNASLEQKIATGFHRNTLTNTEGGVDQEEFRTKAVKDRTNTTGTVWLGLTVACAECHNHKYDAISQKEYYGLYAFFNQADEKNLSAPFPDELKKYQAAKVSYDAVHNRLESALQAYDREEFPQRFQDWLKTVRVPEVQWSVLQARNLASEVRGVTFSLLEDQSILVGGANPQKNTYTIELTTDIPAITALQIETLLHDALPGDSAGRSSNGNFVLSELTVERIHPDGKGEALELRNASADYEQNDYKASDVLDGKVETGWGVSSRQNEPHRLVVELKSPLKNDDEIRLRITLQQDYGRNHTLGRFRLLATGHALPVKADEFSYDLALILQTPAERRSAEDKLALAQYYQTRDPVRLQLQKTLDAHKATEPEYPKSFVMTLEEREEYRKTHIHERGDFLSPGEEVQPHILSVLPELIPRGDRADRLDLARWLVSPENPLTARVAVNRVWQYLFGEGLVTTPGDFGVRGEKPEYPLLIDWLANEYIRLGWSRKALIKTIVMSSVYQQSSHDRDDLMEIDPKNRLLARQNRFRLEAEVLRDTALQVSQLLVPKIGGPSIKPPLPKGIAELGYANSVKWNESEGEEKYRRGLYIFFQRTVPYPMLITFDCPDSNEAAVYRDRSNTPLQALFLLNSPAFFECAQHLGDRILTDGDGSVPEKIQQVFQICLCREPTSEEVTRLGRVFNDYYQTCLRHPVQAREMILDDPPQGTSTAEAATWVAIARTLMNLEEFMTRE
ncbi:MAG: PSD1 and planctomycete cytochrome C domain-containing protein [bacterium]